MSSPYLEFMLEEWPRLRVVYNRELGYHRAKVRAEMLKDVLKELRLYDLELKADLGLDRETKRLMVKTLKEAAARVRRVNQQS